MDQLTVSINLILLLPIFICIIWKLIFSSTSSKRPPGPTPWPILGNLLQMRKVSHIKMAKLAKIYGPLISVKLGTRLFVVASSPSAASEILKTHDRLFSFRFIPPPPEKKKPEDDYLPASLMWAPDCNSKWKMLRSLCRAELFTAKAIESQASLRQRKVGDMVNYLKGKQGQVVMLKDVVHTTVFNMLSSIIFSKDLIGFGDEENGGLKGLLETVSDLWGRTNISEFYPILEGFDLQGIQKKTIFFVMQIYSKWEHLVKERREGRNNNNNNNAAKERDFLDAMLENDFSDHQINLLVLELFNAGVETTTTAIVWSMAELIRNKEAMKRAREELRREFDQNSIITESDLSKLSYLDACFKESLRLHPPGPFLLPHCASETCQVMNYTIPKNSRVLVNVWAIGRDPEVWEDPLSFKPERFIERSEFDFKGYDHQFLPFGAGRRSCPGIPMGIKQAPLVMANLLHFFDWSLPNDDPQIDMSEKIAVVSEMEKPLLLIPSNRKI